MVLLQTRHQLFHKESGLCCLLAQWTQALVFSSAEDVSMTSVVCVCRRKGSTFSYQGSVTFHTQSLIVVNLCMRRMNSEKQIFHFMSFVAAPLSELWAHFLQRVLLQASPGGVFQETSESLRHLLRWAQSPEVTFWQKSEEVCCTHTHTPQHLLIGLTRDQYDRTHTKRPITYYCSVLP